jgi:hypothetical protein
MTVDVPGRIETVRAGCPIVLDLARLFLHPDWLRDDARPGDVPLYSNMPPTGIGALRALPAAALGAGGTRPAGQKSVIPRD